MSNELRYVPLYVKSNGSFLEGASHPDELVTEAHRLGCKSMALTDRDAVTGIVRAHVRAKELGMQLIVGAEVSLDDASKIVLLAMTRAGYGNLTTLLTKGRLRSEKGSCVVAWPEVMSLSAGLIALWGGEHALLVKEEAPDLVGKALKEAFADRLYALVVRHQREDEPAQEELLRRRARQLGIPTVASTEVLYHAPDRRQLQDVLTCIRHGTTVFEAGRRLKPNAEHDMKNAFMMGRLFADDPHAVARTSEIAARCTFSMAEIRYVYPLEKVGDGYTPGEWLKDLTFRGAEARYGGEIPAKVKEQLDKELALIDELGYGGYFLTMKEVVDFCNDKNILCQGRGSAANSAVCFCLGITAIDPVRMDLLFERFLSKERAEPPDIDLDIEHERREEVIQYVYEKYGRSHAAMVANQICYRGRSALRDVGKALGFPLVELERMSAVLSHYESLDEKQLAKVGLDVKNPLHESLLKLSSEIQGFPRHLGIHPGGFLIGHEPVSWLVPIENATMEARTIIQWDKTDIEELGLFKVDLLALGSLTLLHRCFDLLRAHRGVELSMATIPPDDTATFDMLCAGDTVGVFQIESRAQMAMLPRLLPRTYYDLVVEIAIVRPGPITGGMVHPYLKRRRGEEPVEYPHEILRPVLEKTLGVPLFQEQVMKIAIIAADYTPGEADQLRKDMAAWKKTGRLEKHRERLLSRMIEKGIEPAFAERVFEQIKGFGEYGFPESHSASFALITYATAYLRCHYTAEFSCAFLNAQPMGFYSIATIVEDAKRKGVLVRPTDVLHSFWDCTLEPAEAGHAIRMGLRFAKGLSKQVAERIIAARNHKPPRTLEELATSAALDHKSLAALAEGGAFRGFTNDRREALWRVRGLKHLDPLPLDIDTEAHAQFRALTELETISWDYRRMSHSTLGHPLAPLRERLTALGLLSSLEIKAASNGRHIRTAGLVICRQRPGTAQGVTFMTLEDELGFINVVVWQQTFSHYELLGKTAAFLGIAGKVQVEHGVCHLIADALFRPQLGEEPASTGSRDFH